MTVCLCGGKRNSGAAADAAAAIRAKLGLAGGVTRQQGGEGLQEEKETASEQKTKAKRELKLGRRHGPDDECGSWPHQHCTGPHLLR